MSALSVESLTRWAGGRNAVSGYLSSVYAQSLAEFGHPLELPACGGWVLEREIPGSAGSFDAMGPYPLFACVDWSRLKPDVDALAGDLVSLSLVTDPFGDFSREYLEECFDLVMPFKAHFVAWLDKPVSEICSKHHRYYAQKALERLDVVEHPEPTKFLDQWVGLYQVLIERHGLRGIKAFSPEAFAKQLSLQGTIVLCAVSGNRCVGAHIWFEQDDVAYSHLAACSEEGYQLMASYALYWAAFERFTGRVKWLDLGAGAGLQADASDGLTMFKRGWATDTRTAYFCGRIFDREAYDMICKAKGATGADYFPAYRRGEFGS